MKEIFTKYLRNEKFCLLSMGAISCAVMLPILFRGIPYGMDLPHHFQCAYSYYEGFLAGDFYPSWSATRNLGYGGMELRLYPPLSHYSLAAFYWLIRDWQIALWLTLTFYSILGSLGVFFWSREMMSFRQAVCAGCFYAILPYHLNQIYNTFLFAEYVGAAILPFSFWLVYRVVKHEKVSDIAWLAVAYAALILTHLPLTVIGSICFAVYSVSLFKRERFFTQIAKLVISVLLGLGASSFFWIKVLQEKDWLAKDLIYPDVWLNHRLQFLFTPFQIFTEEIQNTIYKNSTGFYDTVLFFTFVLVFFCAFPFVIWTRGKSEENFKGVWLIFAGTIFLTSPASCFLWDRITFLQEVQFPWRWLTIVTITAAVLAASKLNFLTEWFQSRNRPLALIIAGSIFTVVIFSTTQIINRSPFIPSDITEPTVKSVSTARGFAFWWTVWTRKEALADFQKVSAENRTAQIEVWQPVKKNFRISAGEPEFARVAIFYHPSWKAMINDLPVEVRFDENGVIVIPLPAQPADVKLYFQESIAVHIGRWLSVFTFCGLFIFIIKNYFNQKRKIFYD